MRKKIVYMDLFSGTGGFAKGLLLAGFDFETHYFSEIDKYAIANYLYHFKNGKNIGDITKINGQEFKRPNIITFGSPCQDISTAGKQTGFKGKRSKLFFEAMRIIDKCRPDIFVFENVKGIFTSNKGKIFEIVLEAIAKLGVYECQWQLLNTAWFLPQNRQRLYLIGCLRGQSRKQIFPFSKGNKRSFKSRKKGKSNESQLIPTIDTQVGESAHRSPYILYKNGLRLRSRKTKGLTLFTIRNCKNIFSSFGGKIEKGQLRRLTPIECEKLQGFPENWTKYGLFSGEIKEISDTQRYKLLGNSVSVPIVQMIGEKILSFSGHNNKSLGNIEMSRKQNFEKFIEDVGMALSLRTKHDKRSIEKMAAAYGIADRTEVKELTELAIVKRARELAHSSGSIKERFDRIVDLYNSQVNLSHRTSQSILLQQYSTPAPIAYLAGIFCELDKLKETNKIAFEPSAGNGLLTIAGEPERICVNEIDSFRNSNLKSQGFHSIDAIDATSQFPYTMTKKFDAVLTNPPFGIADKEIMYDSFRIRSLEHLMALRALDCMKDDGKAAIIIGGHTRWDEKGRIQAGKNRIFFNYLYSRYNVVDVINIDGHKLYSRQGTAFDVRLILISGRKLKPLSNAPVLDKNRDIVIRSFDELFDRVADHVDENIEDNNNTFFKLLSLYKQYVLLKKNHSNDLLFVRHNEYYYSFANDALELMNGAGFVGGGELLVEGEKIRIVKFAASAWDYYLRSITNMGYKVAIADELSYPKKNDMRILELEAEALELELQLLKTDIGLGAIIPGNIDKQFYSLYLSERNKYKSFHNTIVVVHNNMNEYETFDLDADRMMYMFSIPITLFSIIKGKKVYGISITPQKLSEINKRLLKSGYNIVIVESNFEELGAPYEPASNACIVLNTQVPDSMAFETHTAIALIKAEVGGDIDNFVKHRLKYSSKQVMCKMLSAEQIDAVGMAIYNIEAREQGVIIGDQTGIGKGRVAAAMIRYAVAQGYKPVFLTEKANLFSDIYRDLNAIGSGHLKPFIVNNRESKTDIKDEDGNVVYQAPAPAEQQNIIQTQEVPSEYNFVIGTYSQFNSAEKKPEKPNFLRTISHNNIFILDEAHNSSGSSNTGEFMQSVVRNTKGVVFLSATFAKRPDNFPIYAMKTAIADCNMGKDKMIEAIYRGGVALQEVLSSQLVSEGQMLRRERSFEGIEVNYISLDNEAEEHKAIADNITSILREIIAFQGKHIDKEVEELDKIAVAEGKEVEIREGTSQAGVGNLPYFSKVFQVINQMLFSLKAEAVAERTIVRLREGKKPVIAFSSTMGAFIEGMENEQGMPVGDGDTINADFSEVLKRGLDGILRYTEIDIDGNPIFKKFEISSLSIEAQMEYHRIHDRIKTASTGISISPIDVIIQKLKKAGYTVAEVTGRKYELQLNATGSKGLVLGRKRINTNDAFRKFNNNEVDVLMINQSGSTGASAHAIPTTKVPKDEVRQRVMIVLQAELDISTEVQKRGRINRTGQILKPIYDYMTSAIPAEKRLMMMLQKKLKSLDANTTSNQKQSSAILSVPDFLNKYGDKIAKEYLFDFPEINELLNDPLHLKESTADGGSINSTTGDEAMKVSGRVAVLSTKMQEDFYNEISERYNDYVDYLKQVGEYDLEVEDMKLDAETLSAKVVIMGKGGGSVFGNDSILETVRANVLKKPFNKTELENILNESLKGSDPLEQQKELINEYNTEIEERLNQSLIEVNEKYDAWVKEIPNEKRIKKLESDREKWNEAIRQRELELEEAKSIQLINTEKTFNNRRQYLEKAMKFFYVGRLLNFPVETYTNGKELIPGVFLGFMIDKKKKNPYTASAIKVRFAIANSSKYLAIPASYSEYIMEVVGASVDLSQPSKSQFLQDWDGYIKENSIDRRVRHIVTGNLLQASSEMKGKLVSYTTVNGEVHKGILMPENWNPGEQLQDKVVVPILKALPLIKSMTTNGQIVSDNGISFFRTGEYFKVIVAASRSRGGDIYLDKQLLELVEKNNFEKTSDKMVAMLPFKNIASFVEILQVNHGASLTIHSSQVKDLNNTASYTNRKKIELPPPEEKKPTKVIQLLELEAEALSLELELLAA